MYQTLLFKESPIISAAVIISAVISFRYNKHIGVIISICILIMLSIFYRYKPHLRRYYDNVIISPAQGLVTDIEQRGKYVYVSIYLGLLSNHTQIYPVNGVVIDRIYNTTGKYNFANLHKGYDNEKKIHIIKMYNGETLYITQIAGFFPRRIISSNVTPKNVMAGEYLGMIKFGSRIDLIFIGDSQNLMINVNQKINIGDLIYISSKFINI